MFTTVAQPLEHGFESWMEEKKLNSFSLKRTNKHKLSQFIIIT